MDAKLFWTIVAAIVFVLLWKVWLALLVLAIAVVLDLIRWTLILIKFLVFDWWWAILEWAHNGWIEYRRPYTRPTNHYDLYQWATRFKPHPWHQAQAAKFGDNWWKWKSEGGQYD